MKPYDKFERSLLRAGKREPGPHRLRERTAAAIAATVASSSTAQGAGAVAAKTALSATRLLVAKWLVVGTVGAAAIGSYVVVERAEPLSPASAPPTATSTHAASPSASARSSAPELAEKTPPEMATSEAATPNAVLPSSPFSARRAEPRRVEPVATEPSAAVTIDEAPKSNEAPKDGGLAEEIRLLDQARRALAENDPGAAIHTLDEHARDFRHGSLTTERDALRVDALVARGDRAEARRAAERFLAEHPRAAQVERMRRVVTSIP